MASAGTVDAGTVKAEALQRHLDRVRAEQFEQLLADPLAALPDHIDIALVIQADAPCILTIDGFSIPYHLVRESFPERQMPKYVLRFTDNRRRTEPIHLILPSDATGAVCNTQDFRESTEGAASGGHASGCPEDDPGPAAGRLSRHRALDCAADCPDRRRAP